MLPKKNDEYNDMAVNVKVYEFLSLGKPFVTRPVNARKNLFNNLDADIFADVFSNSSFEDKIREFFDNKESIEELQRTAIGFISSGNTWKDRAKTICEDLVKTKKNIQ